MTKCRLSGCEEKATHRYHYDYQQGEHQVPVYSDICAKHAPVFAKCIGHMEELNDAASVS